MLGLTRQGVVKVVAIALNCQFFYEKRWENTFACDIKGVNLSVCSNAKGAKVILRVKKGECLAAWPIIRHAHDVIRMSACDRPTLFSVIRHFVPTQFSDKIKFFPLIWWVHSVNFTLTPSEVFASQHSQYIL